DAEVLPKRQRRREDQTAETEREDGGDQHAAQSALFRAADASRRLVFPEAHEAEITRNSAPASGKPVRYRAATAARRTCRRCADKAPASASRSRLRTAARRRSRRSTRETRPRGCARGGSPERYRESCGPPPTQPRCMTPARSRRY